MSNEYKPRKATFVVTGKGVDRVFTPVNRRAKTVAKKAGKRTKVTVADLKALVGKGSYKFYFYDKAGVLKPVSLGK
jgi:hypothetical protein